MIPLRVELEGFLSFADLVELIFVGEPLWALCGPNGIGKSAVLDGITYALYGEHRGGAQMHDQLIHHGANGLRVVFEFAFGAAEYRISRARIRAGRTTQKLDRRVGPGPNDWEAVPGIDSAAAIKGWVERKLGLDCKAFTTSVLLRQGEAEKLFSSGRTERLTLLKGIIAFERFEKLSGRVHARATNLKDQREALCVRLGSLQAVTAEELALAAEALEAATRARDLANEQLATAVQRVGHARQWEQLGARRAQVAEQIAGAEARAQDAAAIRAAKARLDELAVVPVLQTSVTLRTDVATLAENERLALGAVTRQREQRDASATAVAVARQKADGHQRLADDLARQAKDLSDEAQRIGGYLKLAEEVEQLQANLTGFPSDLAAQLAQARTAEETVAQVVQEIKGKQAGVQALLDDARRRQEEFASVEVGVTCSRCGQTVDAGHAAREREALANLVRDQQETVGRLQGQAKSAAQALKAAHAMRTALEDQHKAWEKKHLKWATLKDNLLQLGVVEDASALREQAARKTADAQAVGRQRDQERERHKAVASELENLSRQHTALDKALTEATAEHGRLQSRLATAHAQLEAAEASLPAPWRERLPLLDVEDVEELTAERDRLQREGVAARFEQLQHDGALWDEWRRQLAELDEALAAIPADARTSEAQAQEQRRQAEDRVRKTVKDRDNEQRAVDDLNRRANDHRELTQQLREVEHTYDLHARLDNLLGQEGLQRELVRAAEREVISLANDTLQNLSDGDLFLEPDDEATGRDDRAFALRIRRQSDPNPIGVSFLSGSQKFRVAVSIALAIGRFAAGRARPLESVLIDEGFASLDRDGLRFMADELKRLQHAQGLKRIIVISHQEEFIDRFPVGYRLSAGANGTVVEPFRR